MDVTMETTAANITCCDVESSAQDDRIYKFMSLPNNLTCLLISDPTTDKASAAMDVRVGHLSDPADVPGLAHFTEHMLFMGTTKYPNENEYSSYLSSHGGSSNAFTDMESTNYFFDVSASHLEGALDRFAQFFIHPLFHVESTDRELLAVDSEHAKNLQADFWRAFQLSKLLCRQDHPFSKFGSGNLQTLKVGPEEKGLDLRQMLLQFHETFYSANVMKLVVLGQESINDLETLVQTYFSSISNKNISIPTFPGTPFGLQQLSKRVHIVPVRDGMRCLDISFPMREINTLYLEKPTRYLSHLFGHEGKGSILQYLKEKAWANELSAGESRSCSDWSCFTISIDLTDDGLDHVEDVIDVIFQYCNLLKETGSQEWIHEETSTVASCTFRFLSKRNPIDYTSTVSGNMQLYPPQHILSGPYTSEKYDPTLIESMLDYFTPNNMLLFITSKSFEGSTTSVEEWYGTQFSIEDIPSDLSTKWQYASVQDATKLHLPERNDMIASDFSLRVVEGNKMDSFPKDEPRLLRDDKQCRLWYKPDNVFDMPKVNIMALLSTSNAGIASPIDSVLNYLFALIVDEHSNDFAYLASMASLHCSVTNVRKGIELNVTGFNHKAHILVKKLVKVISNVATKLEEPLFERIKDKLMKQYQNFSFSQPYQHAFYAADLCLDSCKWSIEDRMSSLESITMNDVIAFSTRLLSSFHVEALVHGNMSATEASEVVDIILEELKPQEPLASNLPVIRVVKLENQVDYLFRFPEPNVNNTNSCIEILYQIGDQEINENAALALLHHLIKEPAFNILRTNEQLGYIVHTAVKTNGDNIKGLLFLIQSDSYDPIYLDSRIELFLDGIRSKIAKMTQEEYNSNIDALVEIFQEKNKNLGEESSKYWHVINDQSYRFAKNSLIAEEIKGLLKNQILQLYDKAFAKDAPTRKKLSVQVFAKQHMDKFDEAVGDCVVLIKSEGVEEFRRGMSLYPLPQKVDVKQFKI